MWLTGLPSAGKTTLARSLAARLAVSGRRTEILDGDDMRPLLCGELGFSKEDRDTSVRRIGLVARLLASHGVLVLVPVIAPYAAARAEVARQHADHGTVYLEVHVATALETCIARDVKGLYAKQSAGIIGQLTGVDDPYEAPVTPQLVLDAGKLSVERSVDLLCDLLGVRGLL